MSDTDDTKLYIGNIAFHVCIIILYFIVYFASCLLSVFCVQWREADLREFFGKYGSITQIRLGYDNVTGKSKGHAFVDMEYAGDARDAVQNLNGKEIEERVLKVEVCKNKPGDVREKGKIMW